MINLVNGLAFRNKQAFFSCSWTQILCSSGENEYEQNYHCTYLPISWAVCIILVWSLIFSTLYEKSNWPVETLKLKMKRLVPEGYAMKLASFTVPQRKKIISSLPCPYHSPYSFFFFWKFAVNDNMGRRAVYKAVFESMALVGVSILQVYLLQRLFDQKLGTSRV